MPGMREKNQTTLAAPATLSGVGVHSGVPATAVIRPAPAGVGIQFHRVATIGAGAPVIIPARVENVADTRFSTSLANAGAVIGTVEHILAALSLCGIDNAVVEIDGAEAPILDGSAAPIMAAIEAAGARPLGARRRHIRILKSVELADGDRLLRIDPGEGRRLDVSIVFSDAAIGAQTATLDLDLAADRRRIGRARTFCRRADVEALRAAGFSRGGSLDNAIVVDDGAILNSGGLRDPQEFVLHKALDLVGDLALAGLPIFGRVSARRPGHDLNVRFLKALLSDADAYLVADMAPPAAAASA